MSFSVHQMIDWVRGRVVNPNEVSSKLEQTRVSGLSLLASSQEQDVAFFFSKAYAGDLLQAKPGILVTGLEFVKHLESAGLSLWKSSVVIACEDPYLGMAVVSEKFASFLSTVSHLPGAVPREKMVHPSAVVHPNAELGLGVQIGAHCVLEEKVKIGAGSILYPGCYLGPGVQVGEQSVLFPKVTLYESTRIGNRVRIHAGSVLGSDGFGYAPRTEAGKVTGHQKTYHLGRVVVGDDVEIGANVTVDRGTLGDTIIEAEAKIDNDVHLGHNAKIGRGAILCGATALAGSASVGEFAYVGGLTAITNQVHVGARAKVGAQTILTKDVPEDGTAVGNPQRDYQSHFKAHAKLNRLIKKERTRNE